MMADTGEDAAGMMLYVGGLDASVTEALVHAAFIPFGDIKEINMPLDPESTGHKGFAFVLFEDEDDAVEAQFNMDGAELHGRVLRVDEARPGQGGAGTGPRGPAWQDADKWYAKLGVDGGSTSAKAAAAGDARAAASNMLRQGPAATMAKAPE